MLGRAPAADSTAAMGRYQRSRDLVEGSESPHVRHQVTARRTTGSNLAHQARFERPLSGNRAAAPWLIQKSGRRPCCISIRPLCPRSSRCADFCERPVQVLAAIQVRRLAAVGGNVRSLAKADLYIIHLYVRIADEPDRCTRGICDRTNHSPTANSSLLRSLASQKRSFEPAKVDRAETGRSPRGGLRSHMRDETAICYKHHQQECF